MYITFNVVGTFSDTEADWLETAHTHTVDYFILQDTDNLVSSFQ